MPSDIDLDTYFRRIGYTGAHTPTLETLAALHRRQVRTIPFENLNPFLGQPVPWSATVSPPVAATAVVVLGDPAYYPRFGFKPAAAHAVIDPFGAGDAFMALELIPGALSEPSAIRYAPAFGVPG